MAETKLPQSRMMTPMSAEHEDLMPHLREFKRRGIPKEVGCAVAGKMKPER